MFKYNVDTSFSISVI